MGDLQGYTMPDALAKIIKPMPAGLIRLITLKQLTTQAYWVRPVITGAKASACPCCGAIHPLAAHGVCGGCYDPTIKKGLFGPALLDHLAKRAKCGKKIRPSGPKAIKKSISPAPESSSPAATPLAGAGQVESKDPSMQLHFIVQAIRLSIGLDDKAPLSAIPNHIDKLLTNLKHLKEQNDLADIQLALGLTPFDTVADILEKITRIGQMRSDESAMAMREINKNLELTSKNRELTEEIATLNRLLAKEPIRSRDTCESILGILGIGNGFALMAHDTENEDFEAITAGLIRGAIADGVWRADAIGAQDFTDQDIVAKWSALPVPDGYESLAAVLHEALDQAAHGKGLERHADDRPFHDQPIMRETQAVGLGFPAGQARKKILEAVHCCGDHPERAVADLLGAINYAAATVIAIRAMMVEQAA